MTNQTSLSGQDGGGVEGASVPDPFVRDDFAAMWDDYTEANWQLVTDPTSFLERCEDAGLAECVPVDDDALSESFAWERGIEPGGMMWRLTAAGQERHKASRAQATCSIGERHE